jgi:hypothetical protein
MSGLVHGAWAEVRPLLWTSAARPTANWRMRLIVFTAGYGRRHSVGLVQAHSLESCVCENGSGSGEKGRAVHVSVAIDAH